MPRKLTRADLGVQKRGVAYKAAIGAIKRAQGRKAASIHLLKGEKKMGLKKGKLKTQPGAVDDNARERDRKAREKRRKMMEAIQAGK